MGGVATLEAPAVAASGRARARDRGAVELVRFLAAPLRYIAALRALLDGLPARSPGGRRFGAGRAMLGGGDPTATPARAAALAWTLHLLDRHPDVEACCH